MNEGHFRIEDWRIRVVEGAASLAPPVFTLEDVRVGPHPRDEGYDSHIAATTGSSVVWGDEWRFDPDDGRLVSLIWGVPERNTRTPGFLGPVRPATFYIRSLSGECDMPLTRAFTPDRLVCGRAEPLLRPVGFQVAPDLTVLVQDGRWWGWVLTRPLHHLPGGPAPAELGPLISEWFDLISEESLDALDDADPDLGERMLGLRDRATALAGPAPNALIARIDAVWTNFFGD